MNGDNIGRTRRMGARGALAAAAALLSMGLVASPASALAPNVGGALVSLELFPVEVSGADTFFPHVSGDLVSYESGGSKVAYYDVRTGATVVVRDDSGGDFGNDVNDGRVLYGWLSSGGASVYLFDTGTSTTTEVDPQPAPYRFLPALGGNTVAFTQVVGEQEAMFVGFLGGPTIQIPNDARFNEIAQVAPHGGLVVWARCGETLNECDIDQAAWNGTSWVVTPLTASDALEEFPDTDGSLVVYHKITDQSTYWYGDSDICWQPVGGGTETCLELPGAQYQPRISAGIISFISAETGGGQGDVWIYRIADNSLFPVTSTPFDENLSDIDVLADGRVRVAWDTRIAQTPENRDIYVATLVLPPVGPTYHFGGFLQPVDPRPTLNSLKAGAAVPVKFSLGGNQGMSIFAAGYPKSQVIACDSTANVDGIESTVSAGGSSLAYDPSTNTYTYIWKTDKGWAGTCRQLVLTFADGSVQRANFKLK